jgi:hypothetical protein
MKHHISWTGYLEALTLLLVIYYGYIFTKFYLPEYRGRLMKEVDSRTAEEAIPAELLAAEPQATRAFQNEDDFEQQLHYQQSQQTMNDADLLLGRAKQAIDIAAKRPYSPERTITELREICIEFSALKGSPYLPGIAEVISLKCEETGTATLTEEEVSAWWDDQ